MFGYKLQHRHDSSIQISVDLIFPTGTLGTCLHRCGDITEYRWRHSGDAAECRWRYSIQVVISMFVQCRTCSSVTELLVKWTASSEFGTYSLCEQRRFRRACAFAQSRQNLRCSLIQAVSQEEPSDRKPDPWPL